MTENQPPTIPSWNEAYNQPLAQPKKPGETPEGMGGYVNEARLRILKVTNPEVYARFVASQINRTPLSDEDTLVIFGSAGVVAI